MESCPSRSRGESAWRQRGEPLSAESRASCAFCASCGHFPTRRMTRAPRLTRWPTTKSTRDTKGLFRDRHGFVSIQTTAHHPESQPTQGTRMGDKGLSRQPKPRNTRKHTKEFPPTPVRVFSCLFVVESLAPPQPREPLPSRGPRQALPTRNPEEPTKRCPPVPLPPPGLVPFVPPVAISPPTRRPAEHLAAPRGPGERPRPDHSRRYVPHPTDLFEQQCRLTWETWEVG